MGSINQIETRKEHRPQDEAPLGSTQKKSRVSKGLSKMRELSVYRKLGTPTKTTYLLAQRIKSDVKNWVPPPKLLTYLLNGQKVWYEYE